MVFTIRENEYEVLFWLVKDSSVSKDGMMSIVCHKRWSFQEHYGEAGDMDLACLSVS